ncbi:MAG: histidine kinase dimerization/phospho-acceptor domain-containing protein, partial [Acidimicrobiales bacterium]
MASVRARATLAAVVVVGAAFALGAIGLLGILGSSLREGVEASGRAQLSDVVALASTGEVPDPLPVSSNDIFAQLVGPNGSVLAASSTLVGSTPFLAQRPQVGSTILARAARLPGNDAESGIDHPDSDGPYLLLARTVDTDASHAAHLNGQDSAPGEKAVLTGPLTVYVAASLTSVVAATRTVGLALAGGLPVLTALVGALVWLFCGRALRPVEAIRAEVADISERDLHRRVPEPSTTDEVKRLARTMNEMLERLEDGVARQRRFVSDASHELRSPLTTIQATLEVSLAHPASSAWPSVAAEALEEAFRLQRLVEDLLVLASADEAALPRHTELVDLDEVISSELGRIRRPPDGTGLATSESSGRRVSFDLRRVSVGQVMGSRAQLARVVQNLLDNARRHAANVVSVELVTAAGAVTLVIADDGPGLA